MAPRGRCPLGVGTPWMIQGPLQARKRRRTNPVERLAGRPVPAHTTCLRAAGAGRGSCRRWGERTVSIRLAGLIGLVFISALAGYADGPRDNLPDKVRPIPPAGI